MKTTRLLLITFAATLGVTACTLGSPTYVGVESEPTDGDAGAEAASKPASSGSSSSGGATGGTCGTDDFVKPDLAKLTACGDGKGHCFDKKKVSLADVLVPCADATQVCVPDEVLKAGGEKLKTCKSIIGAGACLTSALIPEIEKQGGSALGQDVCDAGQKCLPCTDPRNGNAPTGFCEAIGVHEKECSAGGAAAGDGGAKTTAPGCCTTNGKSNGMCLPETAIPEAQRDKTKADSCAAGNKCVPAAFVEGKPVKCAALFEDGVCMDKCFDDMLKTAGSIGVLSSKGCGSTELCVPCSFLKGQGAPGCN